MLAQLGADVIRVELLRGAPARGRWPVTDWGLSLYWSGLNRGKTSLAVDLGNPRGVQLVAELLVSPQCGVLVTKTDRCPALRCASVTTHRPDVIHALLMGRSDDSPACTTGAGSLQPPDHDGAPVRAGSSSCPSTRSCPHGTSWLGPSSPSRSWQPCTVVRRRAPVRSSSLRLRSSRDDTDGSQLLPRRGARRTTQRFRNEVYRRRHVRRSPRHAQSSSLVGTGVPCCASPDSRSTQLQRSCSGSTPGTREAV